MTVTGTTDGTHAVRRSHRRRSAVTAARNWISLRDAGRRLGVSATTLRRWADAGLVTTFVTPGGHRRFDADSILALLPGQPGRPTMEQLGETTERMTRAYRRAGRSTASPWVDALDDEQRTAFREHGLVIARELLAALDAATYADRSAHLARASSAAAEYGTAAVQRGLSVAATVDAFLRFKRPFVAELLGVARRRGLDTAAATELIGRAVDAIDQLLGALVAAWEAGTGTVATGVASGEES